MAEQNMMGIAGGLKKAGFLPIAVTYGVFATRDDVQRTWSRICWPGIGAASLEAYEKVHYVRAAESVWLQALAELK